MDYRAHHLAIYTLNLGALEDFYIRALGGTVVRRWDDVGIVFVNVGGLSLELTRLDDPHAHAPPHSLDRGIGLNHLAFEVVDVDKAYSDLAKRGARALAPPEDYRGLRSAFLADPDGNVLELLEQRGEDER